LEQVLVRFSNTNNDDFKYIKLKPKDDALSYVDKWDNIKFIPFGSKVKDSETTKLGEQYTEEWEALKRHKN
jgi:hypothetical protein